MIQLHKYIILASRCPPATDHLNAGCLLVVGLLAPKSGRKMKKVAPSPPPESRKISDAMARLRERNQVALRARVSDRAGDDENYRDEQTMAERKPIVKSSGGRLSPIMIGRALLFGCMFDKKGAFD